MERTLVSQCLSQFLAGLILFRGQPLARTDRENGRTILNPQFGRPLRFYKTYDTCVRARERCPQIGRNAEMNIALRRCLCTRARINEVRNTASPRTSSTTVIELPEGFVRHGGGMNVVCAVMLWELTEFALVCVSVWGDVWLKITASCAVHSRSKVRTFENTPCRQGIGERFQLRSVKNQFNTTKRAVSWPHRRS